MKTNTPNACCSTLPTFAVTKMLALFAVIALVVMTHSAANAQSCPSGRYCYYIPPAMPDPGGFSTSGDWVMSVSSGTTAVSYRINGATEVATTVSEGTPLLINLAEGAAQGSWETIQQRGGFVVSDDPLVVAARTTVGPWQSSASIKEQALALGKRFRLGGYALQLRSGSSGGFDTVSVVAPTGAQVTFTGPAGAPNDFWQGQSSPSFTVSLAAGETYVLRTRVRDTALCTDEYLLDGALVTASAPIAVLSGGRGWSGGCGVTGGCGDEGMDNVLPVPRWGKRFVIPNAPGSTSDGEVVTVVADAAGTQIFLDGNTTAVATLGAGQVYRFGPSTPTHYIETSVPVGVYHNAAGSSCELGLSFVAPAEFPGSLPVSSSFNVLKAGNAYITLPTTAASSVTLDGSASGATTYTPPGRSDLTMLVFALSVGNHTVRANSDIQLGVVAADGGTGLYGYYNEFRLPGCGDNILDFAEGCDDGNVAAGDGCNQVCQIEVGGDYTCNEDNDCAVGAYCDLDGGSCVYCLSNQQCNDNDVCTFDACIAGQCSNEALADGTACAGGICYDAGIGSTCVPCADTEVDASLVDLGCSSTANKCLPTGSTVACGPCTQDAHCDDGNECTADTCNVGLLVCASAPVSRGTACNSGAGVCSGVSPASCESCLDTDPGVGVDAGCTTETPFCDRTGNVPVCAACRTTSDCSADDICVNAACVAASLSLATLDSLMGTLTPMIEGAVAGYPGGSRVDVTLSVNSLEVASCTAVVAANQSWACTVGPLSRSATYNVLASITDGTRLLSGTATFTVGVCAGLAEISTCEDGGLVGVCRNGTAGMQCCTGCWDGSSCAQGTSALACGGEGADCLACAGHASCSSAACACDAGFEGNGETACVADLGTACSSDGDCVLGAVCDTLGSHTCEVTGVCGNSHLDAGEACDDGNANADDGCDVLCRTELGGGCNADNECVPDAVCDTLGSGTCELALSCGNGQLDAGESCDDGDVSVGDGCDSFCLTELGGNCNADSECTALTVCDMLASGTCEVGLSCGNGHLDVGEACDDGDVSAGDGCDASCRRELGVACSEDADCGALSVCDAAGSGACESVSTCGNGHLDVGEGCDDGDVAAGDGCSAVCQIELGFACSVDDDCEAGISCDEETQVCSTAQGACDLSDPSCAPTTCDADQACGNGRECFEGVCLTSDEVEEIARSRAPTGVVSLAAGCACNAGSGNPWDGLSTFVAMFAWLGGRRFRKMLAK